MNSHDSDTDHDLVGAYVLDALPAEERAAFETHLRSCDACRLEVGELRSVVDALPLAPDLVEPPPDLRDRIVAAVTAEEGGPRLASLPGGAPRARSRYRFSLPQSLLAAAAAIVIVAFGVSYVQLQRSVHDDQQKIAFQSEVMSAMLKGASVMAVGPTSSAPRAQAAMIQPAHSARAYFLVQGLPHTPANKVYQLWLIRGARPQSAGVFTYSGNQPEVIRVPMAVRSFGATAVTEEEGPNGSPEPTGIKLLIGKLTA